MMTNHFHSMVNLIVVKVFPVIVAFFNGRDRQKNNKLDISLKKNQVGQAHYHKIASVKTRYLQMFTKKK